MSDSETFLSRWARRKAEARSDVEPDVEAEAEGEDQAETEAGPAEADMPPDEETRQRWIAELEQIDIDGLAYDDDFAVYMKGWVPASLRQRALRKLWTTNPTLACLDGLNDYEEDFTDAATVVANLKSDWLPGRGYKVLEKLGVIETAAAEDAPAEADDTAPATEHAQAAGEPGEAGKERAAVEAEADPDRPAAPDPAAPPDDKTA